MLPVVMVMGLILCFSHTISFRFLVEFFINESNNQSHDLWVSYVCPHSVLLRNTDLMVSYMMRKTHTTLSVSKGAYFLYLYQLGNHVSSFILISTSFILLLYYVTKISVDATTSSYVLNILMFLSWLGLSIWEYFTTFMRYM